ncbi:N-terminal nucleophile aminohydrolases superfamily protein [Prunus dulcis]|uniref:N-terminal nucleophile aminohydrolases superfamily protein n=1 Tax=Prunus dulcis TaxID=3755 RepID=A0A4Y1RCU4_PRUDU|nr:N-terminal nucleophile aminohydrolases superfamily protein [Prunus dulcis]
MSIRRIANRSPGYSEIANPGARAVEVRRIHHRSLASAPPSKVEKFGFGQITRETLPKFRQKSKGEFKKNLKQEGCRTRTGLGPNSKVEIGSGPVNLRSPDWPSEIVEPTGPGSAGLVVYRLVRLRAPEVQSTHRRDLRRVQLARTSSEWTFFHN